MKMELQVCNFKQAEKLKKLGFNLDTQYFWVRFKKIKHIALYHKNEVPADKYQTITEVYPAPTVAELGVLLGKYELIRDKYYENWMLTKTHSTEIFRKIPCSFGEAEARAGALIWLIENEYLKVEDLKL